MLTLLLSGCYSTHGGSQVPGYAIKASTSTGAAYVSKKLFKTPWILSTAVCALIIGYEYEDTRGFRRFHAGKLDSALDMTSACIPGFTLSWAIR